jgi:hypothetical protein
MADEWNEFTSLGNIEFYSMLGNLWDYDGIYENRIKSGKSIRINNPTISILAANTPTGFALAFPSEIIGQGFFSRLLLIHGKGTGRKITWPKELEDKDLMPVVEHLITIRQRCQGKVTMTPAAMQLLDKIYTTFVPLDDPRFASYSNRRFAQLLKLCIIVAACNLSTTIDTPDVLYANTMLVHAERGMPEALGEFGKGKNSEVTHIIMEALNATTTGLDFNEIFNLMNKDLTQQSELTTIISSLAAAGKIQRAGTPPKFFPKRKVQVNLCNDTVDFGLLTSEERGE